MKRNTLLKLLLTLLLVCITAFCFTACGGNNNDNTGSSGNNQNNSQTGGESNGNGKSEIDSVAGVVVLDGLTYAVSNCVATVIDCDTSITFVNIPKKVVYQGHDFMVTSIGEGAFHNCNSLSSVEIPDSVTDIANSSFSNTSIQFNEYGNCKYLGNKNNPYLALMEVKSKGYSTISYIIHKDTKVIADCVFYDCWSLESIEIPDSVTSIGGWAFHGCHSLKSVEIGDGVTSIGKYAFEGCNSLTRVDYSGTIDQWAQIVFGNYESNPYAELYINGELVTEVVLTTATKISNYAFFNFKSLTSIAIGNSVTSIGKYAFEDCTSLTSVVMGDSVTSIGKYAFKSCTSLTSIEIPNSVTSIGYWAFYNCSSLTRVDYTGTIDQWAQIYFDGEESNPLYYANNLYIDGELVTGAKITTATKISSYAFYNCTSLTSIEIPNSVTNIEEYAFSGCTFLQHNEKDGLRYLGNSSNKYLYLLGSVSKDINTARIDNQCKIIGYDAFYGCDLLTSVEMGDNVTSIGNRAFYSCDSLIGIEIPDSVSNIGDFVFRYCPSLQYNEKDGLRYLGNSNNKYLYLLGAFSKDINTAKIDDQCKFIGSTAFYDRDWLTSVVIGDNVTSIGRSAFASCGSLTNVLISESVTSIGDFAFENCTSLKSLQIPDSVTSIGEHAFHNCTSLTSVEIGDSITDIGEEAFGWCYTLVEVYNRSSLSIVAGDSNNGQVGLYAFNVYTPKSGESKLSTTQDGYVIFATGERKIIVGYVGNEVGLSLSSEVIDIYHYAFSDCDSLTSVVIGDSVTSIGERAFYHCTSLTSVVIGDSVTSIDAWAFLGCTSLTSITYNGTVEEWNAIEKYYQWSDGVPATQVICTDGEVDI